MSCKHSYRWKRMIEMIQIKTKTSVLINRYNDDDGGILND